MILCISGKRWGGTRLMTRAATPFVVVCGCIFLYARRCHVKGDGFLMNYFKVKWLKYLSLISKPFRASVIPLFYQLIEVVFNVRADDTLTGARVKEKEEPRKNQQRKAPNCEVWPCVMWVKRSSGVPFSSFYVLCDFHPFLFYHCESGRKESIIWI